MLHAPNDIHILTLSQLGAGQDWRVALAHDLPQHMLIWINRGQGRVLLDGQRRGVGVHNALFVPAESLFALDLARQSMGHVVLIPQGTPLRLPQIARHLRIRDAPVQAELSGLIEGALREDQSARALKQDALEAHAALMTVWLRRQILEDDNIPAPQNGAARLSARFCRLVAQEYRLGQSMAAFAAKLDVTPTHLTRAVKAATGKTAADLLTERLLHAARVLLLHTEQPAKDIARHLGFGSAAYFTRFVQQHTGKPPSVLRAERG